MHRRRGGGGEGAERGAKKDSKEEKNSVERSPARPVPLAALFSYPPLSRGRGCARFQRIFPFLIIILPSGQSLIFELAFQGKLLSGVNARPRRNNILYITKRASGVECRFSQPPTTSTTTTPLRLPTDPFSTSLPLPLLSVLAFLLPHLDARARDCYREDRYVTPK